MRHGRSKAARKTLQFFHRTQGIRPPYQLLLDGTLLVACLSSKLPLLERLDRLLQHGAVHVHMTQSSLDELRQLQEQTSDTKRRELLTEATRWAKQHVGHILTSQEIPSVSSSCIASDHQVWTKLSTAGQHLLQLVSDQQQQQQRYLLASQDETLLDVVRHLGTVPVIRLARGSVLLLESPSKAATQHASQNERTKWSVKGSVTEQEKLLVDVVKKQQQQQQQQSRVQSQHQQQYSRRKPKAKGPNPLSVKKKRTISQPASPKKRGRKASTTSTATA